MEQKLEEMIVTNNDLIFEQKKFSMISIDPSNLDGINFNDPSYLDHLLTQLIVHPCNETNFLESIAEYSKIKQYPSCNNMETQVIGFNNKHVYEITFLIFKEGTDMTNINKNYIGTLLNIEGCEIYGTCLLFKSYISDIDYSMKIVNINPTDIGNLLLSRKEPKMVIYELGDWSEKKIFNLEKFKKSFFEENYCIEENLDYMNYSLKIIYTKSDYGEKAIPEISNDSIECMIVYSTYGNMIDNFTIVEFNKIRKLLERKILQVDSDLLKKKEDKHGRKIINTKYRLLNLMYDKHK
tara:strand:+ start:821 stop:1705 length:885 start_codon:yes stop_codon:yes gene_type:complete